MFAVGRDSHGPRHKRVTDAGSSTSSLPGGSSRTPRTLTSRVHFLNLSHPTPADSTTLRSKRVYLRNRNPARFRWLPPGGTSANLDCIQTRLLHWSPSSTAISRRVRRGFFRPWGFWGVALGCNHAPKIPPGAVVYVIATVPWGGAPIELDPEVLTSYTRPRRSRKSVSNVGKTSRKHTLSDDTNE